jgi:uncharacterized membrane protein
VTDRTTAARAVVDPHPAHPGDVDEDGSSALRSPVPTVTAGLVAAGAVTVAGVLHLLAALEHVQHQMTFAVFFIVVGLVQTGAGAGLRRGSTPLRVGLGLAALVGLVVLYVYSRTIGLQIGPHADRPEDPDFLGITVVVCELATIAAMITLLPDRLRSVAGNAVLAVGIGVWVLWATGVVG